jgi:hypothetical protein
VKVVALTTRDKFFASIFSSGKATSRVGFFANKYYENTIILKLKLWQLLRSSTNNERALSLFWVANLSCNITNVFNA